MKESNREAVFRDLNAIADGKKRGVIWYMTFDESGETESCIFEEGLCIEQLGAVFLVFAESIKSLIPKDVFGERDLRGGKGG